MQPNHQRYVTKSTWSSRCRQRDVKMLFLTSRSSSPVSVPSSFRDAPSSTSLWLDQHSFTSLKENVLIRNVSSRTSIDWTLEPWTRTDCELFDDSNESKSRSKSAFLCHNKPKIYKPQLIFVEDLESSYTRFFIRNLVYGSALQFPHLLSF